MEPILRSAQVLKQEAEEIGYEGKEVTEYVKQHQALDREERAAWRDAQKLYAEEKREHMRSRWWRYKQKWMLREYKQKRKRADEIQIQMAKKKADKELTLKEMEGLSSNQYQCCG